MEELQMTLKKYWWVATIPVGLLFLVGLFDLISRRPAPPQKIEIKATPIPTPKIVRNPISTVTVDDLTFSLPSWVTWEEEKLAPREPVQTMLVGTDYAKDMPGRVFRASTVNQNFLPRKIAEDMMAAFGKQGFTTISVDVERADGGKTFVLKPTNIIDEDGETSGMVWSDGVDVRYVGWSYVVKRHNKVEQLYDVDYGVFVSEKLTMLEVLNAVRLK